MQPNLFNAHTVLRQQYRERREGIPTMKTLANLKDSDCHFPIGDPQKPGFGYCGCKAMKTKAYCFKHYRVMYPEPVEVIARAKASARERQDA
jgi:hypothetical protein